MTTLNRFTRALVVSALASLGASGAFAQASWDIDACSGGSKNISGGGSTGSSSGYSNCGGTGAGVNGVTMSVKAYTSTGSNTAFSAANINSQSSAGTGYIGVLSGSEVVGSNSPHHAVDNYNSLGNSYELVHLQFSKAVDLSQIIATWSNDSTTYGANADFEVYRWDYDANVANPTITSFKPNAMTGWSMVQSGDFETGLTKSISDGTYFSSSWLVATKFGGSNDAFKLGKISASSVCTQSQLPGGSCGPTPGPEIPEPASLALFAVAALGAGAARRRAAVKRV